MEWHRHLVAGATRDVSCTAVDTVAIVTLYGTTAAIGDCLGRRKEDNSPGGKWT